MPFRKLASEEIEPTQFAVADTDIPHRRAGIRVLLFLIGLTAGWYLTTLGYIAWDTYSFRPMIEEHLTAEPNKTEHYVALERYITNHDEAQRRLWDSAERIELALVALLSAVAGYSMRRDL